MSTEAVRSLAESMMSWDNDWRRLAMVGHMRIMKPCFDQRCEREAHGLVDHWYTVWIDGQPRYPVRWSTVPAALEAWFARQRLSWGLRTMVVFRGED